MGKIKFTIQIIFLLLFTISSFAYEVKMGETLSDIARSLPGNENIYVKGGRLEKLIAVNPEIKNPHKIRAGTKINLDHSIVADAVKKSIEAPQEEIIAEPKEPTRAPATVGASQVAPEPNEEVSDPEEIRNFANVRLGYGFSKLSATEKAGGATAEFQSKFDLKVQAEWEQKWSDDFSSFVGVELQKVTYDTGDVSNKIVRNPNRTKAGLFAGGLSSVSEKFRLRYSVAYSNQLFLYGVSSGTISISGVNMGSATVEAEAQLVKKGKTKLDLIATGAYFGGGTSQGFRVDSGPGYGIAARLAKDSGNKGFSFTLGGFHRSQDMLVQKIGETSIFGVASWKFSVFGE